MGSTPSKPRLYMRPKPWFHPDHHPALKQREHARGLPLPEEIVRIVLSYLDLPTIVNLPLVCTQLYWAVMRERRSIWAHRLELYTLNIEPRLWCEAPLFAFDFMLGRFAYGTREANDRQYLVRARVDDEAVQEIEVIKGWVIAERCYGKHIYIFNSRKLMCVSTNPFTVNWCVDARVRSFIIADDVLYVPVGDDACHAFHPNGSTEFLSSPRAPSYKCPPQINHKSSSITMPQVRNRRCFGYIDYETGDIFGVVLPRYDDTHTKIFKF